jgi:hypothetical protein
MTTKLTVQDIANAIPKAQEVGALLDVLQRTREAQRYLPLPALLALYLLHDLYDPASSDSANLLRVTTNLEAAVGELKSIVHILAKLRGGVT